MDTNLQANAQANLQATLAERGNNYGCFSEVARINQMLKIMLSIRREKRSDTQQEALEMICLKLARIANGDPNYADSWRDIAGYAQLVLDELEKEQATSHLMSGVLNGGAVKY